jgi:virulence-associated protein E
MVLSASLSGGNQPPENKLFSFTVFPDNLARKKRQETLDLTGLEALILATHAPRKDKLPLVKMALFGDVPSTKNCLRHDSNMLDITGLEVEHDGEKVRVSFKQAVKILITAGLCCLIYTTPSHKPIEHERWRVLLPLSKPLPNSERRHLVELVNGLFDGALAPESFKLSQAFYFGAVEGASFHIKRLDGVFVDLAGLTRAIGPAPVAGKGTKSTATIAAGHTLADLQALQKEYLRTREGWHNMMLTITASLVAKQFTDNEIQEFCAEVCDLGRDDPEMLDMLASARTKFGAKAIPAGVAAVAAAAAGQTPGRPAITWDYTEKNTIRLSMLNAARAMLGLGLSFKHDTFHNKMFVTSLDGAKADHVGELNDTRVRALRWLVNNTFPVNFEEKPIREAAVTLAERNAFDPVADMLELAEAQWDGVERIDRMAVDYFNAEDTALNRAFVRKLMIAAVRRVRQPGCKFDQILVMESKEGWNKSSAWRVLAGEGNFSDESIMGRETRFVQESLADIWILECAELAGITRREVDAITTFISRQDDRARPAYGHFLVSQPRHSILVGTTNADKWLPKQTGNRRFWPLRVLAPINLKKLKTDRLQLWGEAARYEAANETLVLNEDLWGDAGVEQEARRITDPWEDVLIDLKPIAKASLGMVGLFGTAIVHEMDGFQFVTSADIFEHVLKRATLDYNNGRRLATVMRQLGWERSKAYVDGLEQRGYRREPQQKKNKPALRHYGDTTKDT